MFNGKIHYFDWAIFNSYVSLPQGNIPQIHELDDGKLERNLLYILL